MSLFNRRSFLLSLTGLAACGFEPAYGPNGSAAGLRGTIRVDDPTEKNSYDLVKQLEDRLGQPVNAQYGLAIDLELDLDDLAITQDQEILRYNLSGIADFSIYDLRTKESLYKDKVRSFTSYSATGTNVSTRTAEEDAYRRLMVIIADQMTTKLIASSGNWRT
ncbi:MAG: LPS assembly lipoprotein LptE [Pseudoruegeria sp.]